MSNKLLNAYWPAQMPPTQKAVLVAMADRASDEGECWLSIPSICLRTCFSERAVHRAIKWLEEVGVITADRTDGRHTRYLIAEQPPQMRHPRISGTPADAAEQPPQMRQSPPQMRQKPLPEVRSNHINPLEPKIKSNRKKAPACAVARPDEVAEQVWGDWLVLRKAKRAPVTETVLTDARAEAAKAAMPLQRFLSIWCARGSQGLQAEWLKPNERAGPAAPVNKPSAAADFRGKTYESTPIEQLPEYLRAAAAGAGND